MAIESGSSSLPAGLSADWRFERDWPCPSCGYNLRMLREPRCPECGEIFRWQQLVLVTCPRCDRSLGEVAGDACPACRLTLDWAALLSRGDPRRLRLYEYTQRPVRAAIGTWLSAVLPWQFWRDIPLEAPPVIERLRRLRFAAWSLLLVGGIAALVANRPAIAQGFVGSLTIPRLVGVVLLPVAITMVGLPLFSPTLTRFRVRSDQLLRCWAYGSAGLAAFGLVLLAAAAAITLAGLFGTGRSMAVGTLGVAFIHPEVGWTMLAEPFSGWLVSRVGLVSYLSSGIVVADVVLIGYLWWWGFLLCTLRSYLRLRVVDVAALFLSTQVIAVLAVAILLSMSERFVTWVALRLAGM